MKIVLGLNWLPKRYWALVVSNAGCKRYMCIYSVLETCMQLHIKHLMALIIHYLAAIDTTDENCHWQLRRCFDISTVGSWYHNPCCDVMGSWYKSHCGGRYDALISIQQCSRISTRCFDINNQCVMIIKLHWNQFCVELIHRFSPPQWFLYHDRIVSGDDIRAQCVDIKTPYLTTPAAVLVCRR